MKRVLLPTSAPNYTVDQANGEIRIRPRGKLLERLPATASRTAAFDLLHERLAVATEFFQHHGDGGRYGVYRAMADTIEFLTSRGIPQACLKPLEAVMAAIVDADVGVTSPIFEPNRKPTGGRPRRPVIELEFDGHLATVTECCVRHCKSNKQRPYVKPATDMAAKMINESAWPVKVTANQLKEIRERIQQSGRNSPDRRELEISLSSELARAAPLEWAKILLKHEWVNPPPKLSV